MRKGLNNQSLQLYSHVTHQAVSIYTHRFPIESNKSVIIYMPRLSLQARLLLNLFSGLLKGTIDYAIYKLSLKIQKVRRYFLDDSLPIIMIEKFAQNYTQLSSPFYLMPNISRFPLINISAALITGLQYGIGIKYPILGERYIIQFFTNIVQFLSTMASIIYSSDESHNPIQIMAEYTLQFLSSLATGLLLKHSENPTEALLQAIKYNCPTITRLLLFFGANVNVLNESETTPTPLHLAVYHNRGEIVSQLLAAGANVNAINGLGETPLHLAITIQARRTKIVTKLLRNGASVNATNNWGETPLYLEVLLFCRNQIIKKLLVAGANLNIASADPDGRALFLLQARGIALDILIDILHANNGFTPLCIATLSFNTRPDRDGVKKMLILLLQATFLHNPTIEKPSFFQNMRYASRVWEECTEEIKRLKNPIYNSSLSLWDICVEKNIDKLTSMVQNEEICRETSKNNFIETYSYFKDKFHLNFKKGKHRSRVLDIALSTVSFWSTPLRDNKDCWGQILKYLDEKSLEHIAQAYR